MGGSFTSSIGSGKQENAEDKHNHQCAYACVLTATGLGNNGDQGGARAREAPLRAVCLKKTKVFSGFFGRNDFAEIQERDRA